MHPLPPHSPIHSLPPELLSHIFLLTLPPLPPSAAHVPPPNLAKTLSTLQLVCRRWQEVVQRTPGMWRVLGAGSVCSEEGEEMGGLEDERDQGTSRPAVGSSLLPAIRRSGALPLCLFLSGAVIPALLAHPSFPAVSGRVKSLSLTSALKAPSQLSLPALKWHKLDQLALHNIALAWDQLNMMLHSAPGLKLLHLASLTLSGPARTSWNQPQLQQLNTLELVNLPPPTLRSLLLAFASPSVRTLFVGRDSSFDGEVHELGQSVLAHLPQGALEGVSKLSYGGAALSSAELVQTLRICGGTRQLVLFETWRAFEHQEWVDALARRSPRPALGATGGAGDEESPEFLVPELQKLSLWNVHPPLSALHELVDSRLVAGTEFVNLSTPPPEHSQANAARPAFRRAISAPNVLPARPAVGRSSTSLSLALHPSRSQHSSAPHTPEDRLCKPLKAIEMDTPLLLSLYWSDRKRLENAGVEVGCFWPEWAGWRDGLGGETE